MAASITSAVQCSAQLFAKRQDGRVARKQTFAPPARANTAHLRAWKPATKYFSSSGSCLIHKRSPCATRGGVHIVAKSDELYPLPQTVEAAVKQAVGAIKRSLDAGQTRQQVSILLPVEQRRDNYMFTESMEYPENATTIYQTASLMAESIIRQLGVTEPISLKRIDDDGEEGEPVGLLTTPSGEVTVVMLPTADVLGQLKEIEKNSKTMILMNPMWRTKGNIVSDFGFGPWRKRNEEFVAKFKAVYSLTEQRIGAASTLDPVTGDYMGLGGVARILFCDPGEHQVFAIGKDGSSECIASFPDLPEYKELEGTFAETRASLTKTRRGDAEDSEDQRLQQDVKQQKQKAGTVDWSLKSAAEIKAAVQAGSVDPEDVKTWDKAALRAALSAYGLPASGNLKTLRERVVERMKVRKVPY